MDRHFANGVACVLFATIALRAQDIPVSVVTPPKADARYAYRVADWIWTSPEFSCFVGAELREELEADIRLYEKLRRDIQQYDSGSGLLGPAELQFDKLEVQIAQKLSQCYAVRDLTRGLDILKNTEANLGMCVRIDPTFSSTARETITRAAELFLQVATDEDVVKMAFDASISDPTPVPDIHEIKDGSVVLDRYGVPEFTSGHKLKLFARTKPENTAFFTNQLVEALSLENRDPSLLVISAYDGDRWKDEWWGTAVYGFYYSPWFRLNREAPARGYFYIRLNEDRLKPPAQDFDNPAFWAGKIAHECLHNLWYRHPFYKNARERDDNNPEGKMAFIVAYERAVTKAASAKIVRLK